ncbi:Thiamine transporter ThiT [Lentibacillus sp. JNUCC-1]|uniref:energy-coupled thiamine transporter ThiT n=1 Tax=Lentibacillus sp. JNUCC-1 TaxID=2654513 RepID=UPI0012E8F0CA|nr:energy-coupled thiamine transporter ThiT [Lentibacillus sp. JNUCC-1]MUV36315.1 Thiamine transporter ThiT [Lentibacillus sp. JNUCC-1]
MQSTRILFLIEISMLTALALALDVIPFLNFKVWAMGGSVSLAMVPVFIAAFRWGIKGGLLSGFLWGVLQVAVGQAFIVHWAQALIEYGLAFTVIGFAGLFAGKVKEAVKSGNQKGYLTAITLGVALGSALRFLAHYFAGVIFFGSAIESQSAWLYSFLYNVSYMVPTAILSVLVVYFLFRTQPKTLLKAA